MVFFGRMSVFMILFLLASAYAAGTFCLGENACLGYACVFSICVFLFGAGAYAAGVFKYFSKKCVWGRFGPSLVAILCTFLADRVMVGLLRTGIET